ncbi:hypothetical protein CO172_02555 [Candidatus Uhrbacteria bacterium CG_4_9_14_3_um_filter_36_7]|uniref:PrsW family intramembrane metalloprotease n=1 Tax=Candidatus Uhrbacteria bacterium CG_4_9_14_3_um_filter_36_7 TaxID=1975033 RepID=A0A2M7XH69_9BACT|nr:MAG: hypothetical protein CO172_02555 [Candidatus Uhrbacteria bacterium CG_4_9_14_3_um_filter_36_7]
MESTPPKTITTGIKTQTFFLLIGVTILYLSFLLKNPSYVWIDTWFMIEIFILTLLTRTISIRSGFSLFSQGVLISAMLTLLFYRLITFIGLQDSVSGEMIVVIFEELIKFAPVALAAFLFYKREKIRFNLSDFLFLSVMCAAGFSLFEKTFWQGVSFPFTYGPHLGNIYFFSDALGIYVNSEPFGYIGHAAATGLVGMGVGLGLWLKAQKKTFWWIVPIFAFMWVTTEHLLSNLYYVDGRETLLSLGGGMLTPWIFIFAFAVILYIDIKNLRTFLTKHPEEQALLKKDRQDFFKTLKEKKFDYQKTHALIIKLRAINSFAFEESLKK